MDPLSLISGTIGVAGAAIQAITVLAKEISAIKDVPDNMKKIRSELDVVEALLRDITRGFQDSRLSSLQDDAKSTLQKAILSCKEACDDFRAKLQKWLKHSHSKISWRDRTRIGLFGESDIKALNDQLHIYIDIMGAVLSSGAMFSISQSGRITAEMKGKLKSMEAGLSRGIQNTDKRVRNVSIELQNLSMSYQSRSDADRETWAEGFRQLQNQLTALDQSRKIHESLIGQAQNLQAGVVLRDIHMSSGGQVMAGFISSEPDPRITQDFRNITATSGGKGMFGVIRGVDVNAFFKS